MKNKILGKTKKNKKEIDYVPSDGELSLSEADLKPKRPRKKADPKPKKVKAVDLPDMDNRLNFMKTDNKLIGEIANNELYNSDEDLCGTRNHEHNTFLRQELDLDFGSKPETKEKAVNPPENKFLQKMKLQKQKKEENQGIESQVINLGFVQTMASKLSANELAANGIQLSIRENIIKFIQGMDKDVITQKEQTLLKVLQNSQEADKEAAYL